jgi:hypothetical protein
MVRSNHVVEECLNLDLSWLMRLGPIRNGQSGEGKITWSNAGDSLLCVRFRLDLRKGGSARLILRSEALCQTIALIASPQHLGGHRWWMRCPETGERLRTLHLPPGGDRFASRKALRLSYRVERISSFDRAFEKLFRAQRRLGARQGLSAGLVRPKGMWANTYALHAKRIAALEIACGEKIVALMSP